MSSLPEPPAAADFERLVFGGDESGSRDGAHPINYGVLPGSSRVHALVPIERRHRKAAATSLRRRTNQTPRREVAVRTLLAGASAVGLLAPLLRQRRQIARPAVGSVAAWIAATLGRDDVVLVGGTGSARPNAKPVLEVLAPDGAVLAWAKVGWNNLTRRLVVDEFDAVSRYYGRRPDVMIPEPLARTDADGYTVVMFGALDTWSHPWRRARPLSPAQFRAIAELGGEMQLARPVDSRWLSVQATRVAAVVGDPDRSRRLLSLVDYLAANCSHPIEFGILHGDLVPWNILTSPTRVSVWDWERSRDHMPFGLDVIHYTVQEASRGNPSALWASLADRPAIFGALRATGIPDVAQQFTLAAYLLEMELRFEQDRRMVEFEGLDALCATYRRALDMVSAEIGFHT